MKEFFTSRLATISNFLATQRFTPSDLKNLFSWNYWTEANIPSTSPDYLPTVLVLIIFCAGMLFWRRQLKIRQQIAPVYDSSINQLANIVVFLVIVAISYLFFRSQAINYLSSRLVILTTLAVAIVWLGYVIYYQWRITPVMHREYLERERFFRYIPKKKEKSPTNKRK